MNRKLGWELTMGFDPAAPDAGGGGPASAVVTPGAPATPTPGAGAPPPASPSGAPAGPGAAPRMYTSEEVSNTVRERLAREQEKYAPYKDLGDPKQVSERLARLDKLEKALKGEPGNDPHSAEERELRDLLTRLVPGVDKVGSMEERLAAMEQMEQQRHIQAGGAQIKSLASEKFGALDESAAALVEGAVSASIAADKEALKAFFNGGREKVVAEHFAKVFEKQFDPFLRSASARYSGGKAADKAEVPPTVPKGGVQAPASQERKLSGEERREAAWKRMQELGGGA